jgi:hypothetical protein
MGSRPPSAVAAVYDRRQHFQNPKRPNLPRATLLAAIAACAFALGAQAQPAPSPAPSPVASIAHSAASAPRARKIKAVDADNHTVVLNRPGLITLVLGTSEDSQDAARAAGKSVYPLQGRPDFQLVVVVDLRNSIASWVPSIVVTKMRSNLDEEATELKPYFLKNGNKSNPRYAQHVVPDFTGTICPQLGWTDGSDVLRGILFGVDGREITRWDKIDDMAKLQTDVRAAVQALIDADKAKAAALAKTQGTKLIQPSGAHPPLLPPMTNIDSN